jgi:predicted HAD superfamily Cof-like phosphohydrolase
MIQSVYDFNRQVVGVPRRPLTPLEDTEHQWLVAALREEADELEKAQGDLVESVDAVIDSIIFAIGGLCRMGLTPNQAKACFDAVMVCNSMKVAGKKPSRDFGDTQDAVKPADWVGPEDNIRRILGRG